ncbi:DUF2336 domain-containing protein [Pseudaquidulcibacter saccharophilus]|uniref:DUF2336 domain-containing protein n=1 Tax=Pseudaquidulcibacter saccharophilus TaxID=2831900 RepID=UPI001EFF3FE0|nr:DUF2336 domain-containing protein [Pseudaquidulcibacter saccharophilus]
MGVNTLRVNLTENDIRSLVKGDTDEDKALACYRLCRHIDTAQITDEERHFAEEILRLVVKGAAERVRRALAITLKSSPNLPSDVAAVLAKDIEAIALPVLEFSPTLTDADLVEILEAAEPVRQIAISRREELSSKVTDAICEHGVSVAINNALHNIKAEFSENGLSKAIERFPTASDIAMAMAERPILPLIIAEKIATKFSGQVFDKLVERHALPPQLAIDIANDTRERASLDLIAQASMQADLRRYVQQLNLNGKLTPSFVLRALCQGEVRLVEYAMAELAGIEHSKAWLLVHDGGTLGLRAIFDRAHMPSNIYPAFRAAIDVLHETEFDGSMDDKARFRKRMIERVLTRFQSIPDEDVRYLLDKLDVPIEDVVQDSRFAAA